MSLIELTNLTKTFGDLKAVDDVTLNVDSGEIFGFLGPNGAGKSTTIRCMMGFIFPDAGSINIAGENLVSSSSKYLENVGYVSSDLQLKENWTGNEHIKFISKARNLSSDPSDLIERLGFDVHSKVKNLSTGNKQKLALILALMPEPKLLLLDEPSKGLDPLLQETIYEILDEFKLAGGCVFFSSHNLAEVERVCDRIGIIRKGKLVANETMESLQHKHIRNVQVVFNDISTVPDLSAYGLVEDLGNKSINVRVEGDINPIIRKISEYELVDVNIDHASLEDIFLHFYEED